MAIDPNTITYPRRQVIRAVLRAAIRIVLGTIADVKVEGIENFPKEGPLLVIANHFNFLDPVAMIGWLPYPIEFVGGSQTPNAPKTVSWIAKVYGVLPVYRGSVSRDTLKASRSVLNQKGVLGIFPEAGSWAAVLRPARAGTPFLASSTQAQILPVGLDGLVDVFPSLRKGKRAKVTLRVGKPFGPFYVSDRGESNRTRLDEIGHEMMRKISELLPPNRRGHYSDDPETREAARGTEIYPWDGIQET